VKEAEEVRRLRFIIVGDSLSPLQVNSEEPLAGLAAKVDFSAAKLSSGAKTAPTSMQPFHRRPMLLTGGAARQGAPATASYSSHPTR